MGIHLGPERLRKAVCGSCLVAAPAVLLVGGLLHPAETNDAARLAHQLHEHRPTEAILGGAAALVGVLALFAVAAAETVVIPELGRSSEVGAAALYEHIFAFGSTRWTVFLVAVLLLPLGLVAMAHGLFRARVAPTWVAGALGLGAIGFAVALPTGSPVLFALGIGAMVVGMAPIGWRVLRETDEQWEHPPVRVRPQAVRT